MLTAPLLSAEPRDSMRRKERPEQDGTREADDMGSVGSGRDRSQVEQFEHAIYG